MLVKSSAVGAGILDDRSESFPTLAVKFHHLQLLVDAVVGRRGVADDSGQREIKLDLRLVTCFMTFSRVRAAALERPDQQLRGRVAIGVEARILVALRIVFRHEGEILFQAGVVLPHRIERMPAGKVNELTPARAELMRRRRALPARTESGG